TFMKLVSFPAAIHNQRQDFPESSHHGAISGFSGRIFDLKNLMLIHIFPGGELPEFQGLLIKFLPNFRWHFRNDHLASSSFATHPAAKAPVFFGRVLGGAPIAVGLNFASPPATACAAV